MVIKNNETYLRHILSAIRAIEKYMGEYSFEQFASDDNSLVQDGVVRQLEIIGEAAKNLSDEFTGKENSLPWADIVGMRDKLVHHYFGVNLKTVWRTAKEDLPALAAAVSKYIDEKV